jgi:hypothetical protein
MSNSAEVYRKQMNLLSLLTLDPEEEKGIAFIYQPFGSQNYVIQRNLLDCREEKFPKT